MVPANMKPERRTAGLLVHELPDETVVYDLNQHQAYCLGRATAAVWRHCDGTNSIADISARIAAELGLPEPDAVVGIALEELSRASLLAATYASPLKGSVRRTVLRQFAAMLVISTIMAPVVGDPASPS